MGKEYIEREAAIDRLSECIDFHSEYGTGVNTYGIFKLMLYAVPTADVVARDCYDRLLAENDELRKERPVRHGRWVATVEFTDCVYAKCDQCKVTQVFYYNKPLTNYCPNCGARIDGDGE